MKIIYYLILAVIFNGSFVVHANSDIKINGFGSIVASSVFDGDGYLAEYPNLAIYEDSDLDFGQETRLGLQIRGTINDKMSATTQIIMRSANEYEPEVGWMFLSYELAADSSVQLGRMRVPVYHFSEYMDVGYAYPWIRVPSDTYSLDLTNYNGFRFMKQFEVNDYSLNLIGIYGQEDIEDSELMSYLFPDRIDRNFEDIFGLVLEFDADFIVLRSSYVQSDMVETRHLPAWLAPILGLDNTFASNSGMVDTNGDALVASNTDYDVSFFDVSVKARVNNFNFFAEYNKYDPFYKSYFASISYNWEQVEGYILWSKFDLDQAWESHDTSSIGLRYDFMPNVALKFDVSFFDDTGYNPFTLEPNPVYKADPDGDGDASLVSIGLDFVF